MGPKKARSSLLTLEDEAIILAYRWRTRLALDDAHLRLKRLMPNLSRSTLYRCLKRRGLSRIGPTATCPPLTTAALRGPYSFEITAHEVAFRDPNDSLGVLYSVFLAVEEITKHVYAEVASATPEKAAAFLVNLVAQSPEKIIAVSTEMHSAFTDWRAGFNEDMASVGPHPFAVACRAHGIAHIRSTPPHAKPRKSVPEASKSDSGVFGSTLPVGGMTKALGLAAVSKRPWDILLSLPDTRTARSASKSVPRARPDAKKKP